jgi:hypothetical protein
VGADGSQNEVDRSHSTPPTETLPIKGVQPAAGSSIAIVHDAHTEPLFTAPTDFTDLTTDSMADSSSTKASNGQ